MADNRLPNAVQAYIPLEKLRDYALSPEHETGKHKARVFRSVLGLVQADADFLRNQVQKAVLAHAAVETSPSPHGRRYVVDFELTTEKGTATVRSAWIIRHGEDFPRLTSCYVLR